MTMQKGVFSSWKNPTLCFISSSPSYVATEILGRLARRSWEVIVAESIQRGFSVLENGEASVLLVDDTADLPATYVLKCQLANPVAILTPTIVAVRNSTEKVVAKRIGICDVIVAPISPADFIESLEHTVKLWSSPNRLLPKITEARNLIVREHISEGVKVLTSLASKTHLIPLLAPALSAALRDKNNPKIIEKVLLNGIRTCPKNVGVVLSTCEFYLHSAMPDSALRLIEAAEKNHGPSPIFTMIRIQANLMLNQVEVCIPLLEDLVDQEFLPTLCQNFLSRCYYAEGLIDEFMDSIGHKVISLDQFKNTWIKKRGESA